jgi:hypothetical protein
MDNLVIAIGSTTQSTLNFEDVIPSLLSEEMERKSLEGVTKDVLSVRGHPQESKNKYLRGISKSRGRYQSSRKYTRK